MPSDMFEAINIGIDFFAELISAKYSSENPVVPDTKGNFCSMQKFTQLLNPFGEEKSITTDILVKSFGLSSKSSASISNCLH